MKPVAYRVKTAPTTLPLTVSSFRSFARIDDTTEDTLIEGCIWTAVDYFEERCGRTISEVEYEAYWNTFPEVLVLPKAYPLIEVSEVAYRDSSGTWNVWASSNYAVGEYEEPATIRPRRDAAYPSFEAWPSSAVRVTYRAGSDDSGSPYIYPVPSILMALKQLALAFFENREGELVTSREGRDSLALRYGVEGLIMKHAIEYRF